jgi:hypothetical protein
LTLEINAILKTEKSELWHIERLQLTGFGLLLIAFQREIATF